MAKQPPAQAVMEIETPSGLAAFLLERREAARAGLRSGPISSGGMQLCRELTELTDAVLQQLVRLALPAGEERERVRGQIAVAATGSYGRRELSPFSDVDVTFIVAEEEDETLDRTVRQVFLWLMEVFSQRAQLKVGYAYRTLADLPQLDHQTQTALLDARLVAGSHPLFHRFTQELPRHLWPAAFVRQKVEERREQARRHGETLYRIEPQVREGPGGLRELQVAEWVAAVAFPATRGDVWPQMARMGVLSPRDAARALAAREFFLQARNRSHFDAGRAADLLTRERQEAIAPALEFVDDERASSVERLMEAYYRHAEEARRVAGMVVERALRARLSLDEEIAVEEGELAPAYPGLNVAEPRFLLRICRVYQEHGLRPGPELRRLITEQLGGREALALDPETGQQFLALLAGDAGAGRDARGLSVTPTLALSVELGILQRLIPELGEAWRRVPYDPIHRHTIGHHSLVAVEVLERLRVGDEAMATRNGGVGEFQRLWGEVQSPEVLYLAGLLHDVGKVDPRPRHAVTGAEIAAKIVRRLGMDETGSARVAALVRHHLLMSETSQLRDLTLEETVRDFVALVPDVDLLNMLLLLTVADMEATGVLSPVRVRFLEDLYYRAERLLGERNPAPMDEERLSRYRRRLAKQLGAHDLAEERVRLYCEGMPVSYLLNTRPEQIAAHIRAMEQLEKSGPVVEWGGELGAHISTLTVCTYDDPRPGLLSRMAGVLYAHEIGVYAAQVFTRGRAGSFSPPASLETQRTQRKTEKDEHRSPSSPLPLCVLCVSSEAGGENAGPAPAIAIDTLWVDFHGRQLPPLKKMEVEADLLRVLRGESVIEILTARHKHLPLGILPTRVAFDNSLAEGHTVVDVEAPDQPGLLYRITHALASLGWVIHSARISTLGPRARDAFYITDPAGGKIEGDEAALVADFTTAYGMGS